MRYFFALTLPEDIKQDIARLQKSLQSPYLTGIWVAPPNFHITLKYLGALNEQQLATIQESVAQLTSHLLPFPVTIKGVGAFPHLANPKILWLGAQSKELEILYFQIEDILKAFNFPEENRNYRPHVTLARLKYGQIKENWLAPRANDFSAKRLHIKKISLYNSQLTPKGPLYHVIKHFRFSRPK